MLVRQSMLITGYIIYTLFVPIGTSKWFSSSTSLPIFSLLPYHGIDCPAIIYLSIAVARILCFVLCHSAIYVVGRFMPPKTTLNTYGMDVQSTK